MDDISKKVPENSLRVNVNEPWELRYWSEVLGVTPDELRAAVQRVGPMAENVRREVGSVLSEQNT